MELQQLGAGLKQRQQLTTTVAAAAPAPATAVAATSVTPATPARMTMRDSICSLERDSLSNVVVSVSVNVDVHCDASTAL